MTLAQKAEMERLDHIMVKEQWGAEKGCRKLWLGAHPYSKQLSVAQKHIGVWHMVVKCKKGGKVNSAKIKWLACQAGIEAPLLGSLWEAECSLQAAKLKYATLVP